MSFNRKHSFLKRPRAHPPVKGWSRLPLPNRDKITNHWWPRPMQKLSFTANQSDQSNVSSVIFVIPPTQRQQIPNQLEIKSFQMLPWIVILLNSLQTLHASQKLRLNHHYVSVPRHDLISSLHFICATKKWKYHQDKSKISFKPVCSAPGNFQWSALGR